MDLVEEARALFGAEPRPGEFTDRRHCCECAGRDDVLRSHDPDSIGYREPGSPARDPVCFMTPAAFRNYFPALVRLAVEGRGDRYCLDQFLFHIISDGRGNERWRSFPIPQREFVARLLRHYLETRAGEIEHNLDAERLMTALDIWSGEEA